MTNKQNRFIKLKTNKHIKVKRRVIKQGKIATLRRLAVRLVNYTGYFIHAKGEDPQHFYKFMVESVNEDFKTLGFRTIEDKLV